MWDHDVSEKIQSAEPLIISKRDMSFWMEFLCLSVLPDERWLLDVRVYDCYDGDASDFYNQETDDFELPEKIDGFNVLGTDLTDTVIIDRLVPHLDEEIAKIKYCFADFDWQEFKRSFSALDGDWCTDEVRKGIEAAVSHSNKR